MAEEENKRSYHQEQSNFVSKGKETYICVKAKREGFGGKEELKLSEREDN